MNVVRLIGLQPGKRSACSGNRAERIRIMEMTILKVKKIYDGTRKGEIPEGVLVFDETGILEVLPGWENAPVSRYEQAGRSVAVIDARDVCLVPGLIDSHVHLMMPGDGMKGEEVVSTMSQGEIQLVAGRNAAQALFAGVTTLRDCGGIADVTFSLKSAIEKGLVAGPDLLVCGSPITSTGGHIHYMGGEADGEEEIRRLVRRQKKRGADFVKIVATGGGTRGVVVKGMNLTLPEINCAVEEAHRLHLKATAHVNSTKGVETVLKAEIDGIEHAYFSAFDGTVDYQKREAENMVKKGIVVCQTLEVMEPKVERLGKIKNRTAQETQEYDRLSLFQERLFEMHRRMIEDGVSFIAGTDAGWNECPFGRVWHGLKKMAECGMSNEELLYSATGKAADWLGISEKRGYLRAGCAADFLMVREDPRKDISNLRLVEQVYKNGIRIR